MAIIHMDESNFDDEIKGKVIIDFWAPWCGPCRMMGPVFEEISNDYTGKLKFAKINTDEQLDLASKFDISGIPCLVILKDGVEIDRIVGFHPKPLLKKKIDEILSKIK